MHLSLTFQRLRCLLIAAPFSLCTAGYAQQQIRLTAGDPARLSQAGKPIAISGTTVAVGALVGSPGERGAAYVFDQGSTGSWNRSAKLLPAGAAPGERFATSIAISRNTLVVGSGGGVDDAGALYIYERDSGGTGQWGQMARLVPPADTRFGASVATSGTRIVAGAIESRGRYGEGIVLVFDRSISDPNMWEQVDRLKAPDSTRGSAFGFAVALSGNDVVVGQPDSTENGSDSGVVYLFSRVSDGAAEHFQQVFPSDPVPGANFGTAVAIDGDRFVVGAPSDARTPDRAAAYIFTRNSSSQTNWTESAKLTAPEYSDNTGFAGPGSVAISGDLITVGANRSRTSDIEIGSVYVFVPRSSGEGWRQAAKLISNDAVESGQYGTAVALSRGNLAVAAVKDATAGTDAALAFVSPAVTVQIDVVLGISNDVSIKGQGQVDVGVYSSATFDTRTIDPTTLHFGPNGAQPIKDLPQDLNGDRRLDRVFMFSIPAIGFRCGMTTASLTGMTTTGQIFQGLGAINVGACGNDKFPVANAQSVTIAEDIPKSLGLTATDQDSPSLLFTIITPASHGTLAFTGAAICSGKPANCSRPATYTPDLNYNGPDSFVFQVDDGTAIGTATVSITVTPVNDAPTNVQASPSSLALDQDTTTGVTLSATDFETAAATLKFTITQAPAHGILKSGATTVGVNGTITGSPASLTYQPDSGDAGSDSFKFTVRDRGDTDNCSPVGTNCAAPITSPAVTVSITVNSTTVNPANQKPTASAVPASLTILEDAAATGVTLTGSDAETPGANLIFTITLAPTHGTLKQGTTLLNRDTVLTGGSPASITYQPNADYNGSDSFKFKVTDTEKPAGCGIPTPTCVAPRDSDEVSVPIGITAVNDATSFDLMVNPNQSVLRSAGVQTVNNFAINISAGPANESSQTPTFNFTGNTTPSIFSAGPAISSNGTLTYTPNPSGNGTSTLTVVLKDNGGVANGGVDTSTSKSFTINVHPPNQPPAANAVSPMTNEDNAVMITLSGSDADGDAQTFTTASNPTHGTLGVITASVCSGTFPKSCSATVQYTPNANYNGNESFTYKANDGQVDSTPATVSITINPVNDPPSFTKGADQTVLKNAGAQTVNNWATSISPGPTADEAIQTRTFHITGNTNPLLFSIAPSIASTGTLTYTPAADASGSATINTTLQDSGGTASGGNDTSAPQTFVINVIAGAADTTKPKMTSVVVPDSIVAGTPFGVTFTATDNQSGVKSVTIALTFKYFFTAYCSVAATAPYQLSFSSSCNMSLPGGALAGTYTVWASVHDGADNVQYYDQAAAGLQGIANHETVPVSSGHELSPPELVSGSGFPTALDVRSSTQFLHVNAKAHDADSGVSEIRFWWSSVVADYLLGDCVVFPPLGGDSIGREPGAVLQTLAGSCDMIFDASAPSGGYNLVASVTDNAGNRRFYPEGTLGALVDNPQLTITSNTPPPSP